MPPQREWFEKNYYAVLGVPESASQKDISKAYRRLAREHHPDAKPGDHQAEERFKEISAAYDVLGDAAKRKEYDEVRRMAASGAGPGFGGGGVRFDDAGDLGGLGDILGGLFGRRGRGGAPRGGGPQRGGDLEADLHLSFVDGVRGVTTTVSIHAEAICSDCHGTGAEAGSVPHACPQCGGSGNVAVDQGLFSFSEMCPKCQGTGRIIDKPCRTCAGRGTEVRRRDIKVRIPPGVQDGERIRVKGRGAPGRQGGPPGDLWVRVHVTAHEVFGRKGRYDLTLRLPVTYTEASLGADVKVPTLDGRVTVRIPPGTPSGKTLRVREKGGPKRGGGTGDLLVTVEVAVPKKLSKEEEGLLHRLAELDGNSPREHLDRMEV